MTVGLCFLTITASAARGDDSIRRRFQSEFPAATEKLKEFYANLRIAGTEMHASDVRRWEFCGHGQLMRSVVELKDGSITVNVFDPKLSFNLKRLSGSSGYSVTELGAASPNEVKTLVMAVRKGTRAACAPFCTIEPVTELISEANFKWKDAKELDTAGGKVYRVSWDASIPEKKVFCTIDFAADGSWAVRGYELRYPETRIGTGSNAKIAEIARYAVVEYRGEQAGVPLVSRMRLWSSGPGGKSPETIIEVNDLKPGAVALKEFTLAAFGISTAPAAQPTPVAYYLLGLSGVLALVVMGLRSLSRRRFKAAARA